MRSPLPHPLKQEENSIQATMVREDSFFLEESYPISSLLHPRQEESFLQRNETDEGPISIADKPLQLLEKEESSVYFSVDKKKIPFSLSQRREFLTGESS